jgi:hypothetical protein
MTEIPAGAVTTADLYRELVGMRQDITKALERPTPRTATTRSASGRWSGSNGA